MQTVSMQISSTTLLPRSDADYEIMRGVSKDSMNERPSF